MAEMDSDVMEAETTQTVGERLQAARLAAGLELSDIAGRTRVPLRHLEAIERGDYGALPATTYATGFTRAYARALELDDVTLVRDLREELQHIAEAPEYQPYEAADPARVPEAAEPGGWRGMAYYRLHGSPRTYYSSYEDDYLDALASRLRQDVDAGREVWCIFDNTAAGAAAQNALDLLARLEGNPNEETR